MATAAAGHEPEKVLEIRRQTADHKAAVFSRVLRNGRAATACAAVDGIARMIYSNGCFDQRDGAYGAEVLDKRFEAVERGIPREHEACAAADEGVELPVPGT